jgi:spore germination protein YaaH
MRSSRRATAFFLFAATPLVAGYRIAVWIEPWNAAALSSTQTNAGHMTESNPVWYTLDSAGNIVKTFNSENPTWRAAMTGTQLIPTIQNYVSGSGWSASVVSAIVNDPARREAHATAITNLVINQAYDGIDIDYEALTTAIRPGFSEFVRVLAGKLHAVGRKLSVTVSSKTSDAQDWAGPGGDDYAAIGAAADWVKLMVYDYSYDGSPAGPITPLTWLDQVVAYAETQIPSAKIIVGLPWFGHDWIGTNAETITYQQGMNRATTNAATIAHDANGEATFIYGNHSVYFQDAFAYDQKANMVTQKHPAVAGFAHWSNGEEDPAFWTRVESLKSGTTTPASPPPPPPPSNLANLISVGSVWRYLDNGSDQGTAWRATSFSDSAWRSGAAELGYGDGDEATIVGYGANGSNKYITTYFRRTFSITDPAAYGGLTLRVLRDDGAVIYLNGSEVWRINMPAGAIGYRTLAASVLNAPQESTFYQTTIDPRLLVAGTNVVAVEIHQGDVTSSDISFNLELTGSPAIPAPSNLQAAATSSDAVSLTWTDNSTTESGFKIERCSGTGCTLFAEIGQVAASVTTFTDVLLSPVTEYNYRVRAFDATSNSGYSNSASATTLPPPAPASPTGLVATPASARQINLSWIDNATTEDGFRVERCNDALCTTSTQIAQLAANVITYSDSGLMGATTYSYRVVAFNQGGASAYSNIASATTLTPPPPTGPVTLIARGAAWKYLDNGSDQATAWRSQTFNDAAWRSGLAELGYGDGDERTVVSYGSSSKNKYVTTYFRGTFDVTNPAAFQSLLIRLLRDDGAVVYINGTEAWRSNMPAGAIGYRTFASEALVPPQESTFYELSVSPSTLVTGTNVIAVEIHQSDVGSSDISFNLELVGR